MSIIFSANLPSMFRNITSTAERFKKAINFGFHGVEMWEDYQLPIETLLDAKENLNIVLMGVFSGSGMRGISASPGKESEFKDCLEVTIRYAKALHCSRVHLTSGLKVTDHLALEQEATYIRNLNFAADRLAKEGITGLIEAINPISVPDYFLNNPQKALEIVQMINSPNLRLMLDIFHVQMCQGNLTQFIKESMPYVGHIQISQAPNRSDPHRAGEINYSYILNLISSLNYSGWIGLEYYPEDPVEDCISWLQSLGYSI